MSIHLGIVFTYQFFCTFRREIKYADTVGSVGSPGWPFSVLYYKYIFQIKYKLEKSPLSGCSSSSI